MEFDALDVPVAARTRMTLAVGASAALHAAALALVIAAGARHGPTTHPLIFPISLVSLPGGGGGGGGGGEPGPADVPSEPAPIASPPATTTPPPPARRAARPKPAAPRATAKPAAESGSSSDVASTGGERGGTGGGAGTGGSGGGSGGGGGGFGTASPGYGVNPEPPYPIAARRLGFEGEVVLRVAVAADGRPTDVVVLKSSGHDMLDQSALETVRTRWRFVPARRDGVPVDDTVQVPIRFRRSAG